MATEGGDVLFLEVRDCHGDIEIVGGRGIFFDVGHVDKEVLQSVTLPNDSAEREG